ncbi:MAG TPA: glucose-6-phosphate dehydrogenase assembly protein OpcA [Blastocatellia bacterium]|nr:glucose-6-phosphate dehydrogenase assembly protein OpcA [Blastocatellia bacterium]
MSATSTINVGAIEKELTSLWKQASEDETGGVVRASILNLIAFVPDPAEIAAVDDIVIDVTASHPCRVIALVADRASQESKLTAEVTSRCTLPTPTSKQVCCEQVTITASQDHLDEAPSAIVPLLIADLPVYLWWRAEPRAEDKELYGWLTDIADRVVIDSAKFNEPEGDLAKMAAVLGGGHRGPALSDMNWARLTAWRALIAGFYDVPEYRPLLKQIERVTIEYAPPAADPAAISTRALLLGGWLASRLGWQFNPAATVREDGAARFEFSAYGRTGQLEFRHTERAIEPGHLALVTIANADDCDKACAFTVRRSADGTRIETGVTLDEAKRPKRVLSYEGLDEGALLARELEILGNDRVYEETVKAAGAMIRNHEV